MATIGKAMQLGLVACAMMRTANAMCPMARSTALDESDKQVHRIN